MANALTPKILILIVITVIIKSFADLLFKKGLISIGIDSIGQNASTLILKYLSSIFMWSGLLLYIFTFFIWIIILSKIELSLVYPIQAAGYVLVPVIAILFLNESVSFLRWIGVISIIIGICLLSRSPAKETKTDLIKRINK